MKRLRLLAEYGGFEQNAYWHRRLAKVYRDAAYVNAAIEEFNISINMDGQDWIAFEGMAYCYERRKDYLPAIEWNYKAMAVLPPESNVERAGMLQEISEWKFLLKDRDGAIEASHKAYSLSPRSIVASTNYLNALEQAFKFEAILEFAVKLETIDSDQEGENMLTFLIVESWTAHEVIGNAARRLDKVDSVGQTMKSAIAAVERRKVSGESTYQQFSCLLNLAIFLNKYAGKIDEAIQVCETGLKRSSTRTKYQYWGATFKYHLCQLYYHKAKAAEGAGIPFDHWVSKLEALAKTSNVEGVQDTSDSEDSSLMLGLWYRLHGREQEAKLCFRSRILDGIDTLTDDDPENDIYGYMSLASAFLKAGDRENAGAAFAFTMAPLDRLKDIRRAGQKVSDEDEASEDKTVRVALPSANAATFAESSTSPNERSETKDSKETSRIVDNDADQNADASDDSKFDMDSAELNAQIEKPNDLITNFLWCCDGKCGRPVEDWQELHFCEICATYTSFCDECIKLVKTGTLPFRTCDESHTFFQVYPLSQEIQDIATVKTEGKVLPRKEWLEALRKKWLT